MRIKANHKVSQKNKRKNFKNRKTKTSKMIRIIKMKINLLRSMRENWRIRLKIRKCVVDLLKNCGIFKMILGICMTK